ncbi:hypothetical protein [Parathalassolituus penaei]|uniref:Uncharacterized protein n=1 Tax=Parathalassolituus penaei TaxID=2997323 RepID=A0A9X3EK85_9GAMM|nr:hypothetical protein [Parathalassolituus penaei]MCY0964168.1 hypothetical protein [Parathalassolituus penaei]
MDLKSYDIYGIDCESLSIARAAVEALLDIIMIAHESGYRCGRYYRLNDVGQEHIVLQNNYDEYDDEWTEEKYVDYPFLLYINETLRSSEIANFLQDDKRIVLLKHQEL